MAKDTTLGEYLYSHIVCLIQSNPLQDWFRILSDPDPAELQRMIRVGELVTWPKVGSSFWELVHN